MDSPTIAKNFKYNSSQQPMFSVKETPLHYRSFSQNKFTFEDISFSTYLNPQDTNPDKNRTTDDTEINIFDAQKYFSNNDTKQEEPSEDVSSVPRLSSVSSVDGYGRNYRTRSFHATPTASSEASWNSQSGLLANRPGSIRVSLKNVPSDHQKKKKSPKKSIFGQKCCCTGNKAVEVRSLTPDNENRGPRGIRSPRGVMPKETRDIHHQKVAVSNPPMLLPTSNSIRLVTDPPMLKSDINSTISISDTSMHKSDTYNSSSTLPQRRISASGRTFTNGNVGFSFPILSPSNPVIKPELIGKITKPPTPITSLMDDPPRESLEVFQPNTMTSFTNQRPHFNPGSPIRRVTNTDDDVASDASSDLFEIESFSTQTTSYPMYRRRDSIDDAPSFNARRISAGNNRRSLDEPTTPSVAGTECYAPTEFSVDWSVTTAEGNDKGSVSNFSVSASEFGGAAFLRRRMEEESAANGGDYGKRKGHAGGGLLMMGCRQDKAVNVGPQPMKYTAAIEGPPLPLHVGGRPPRAIKPQMGSCNSARLSLAFAA